LTTALLGQGLSNGDLRGKYHFIFATSSASGPPDIQTLGGSLDFDGNGGYTYQARHGAGGNALVAMSGSGSYSVATNGFVSLSSPLDTTGEVDARLGRAARFVLGSPVSNGGERVGVLAAVKAPSSGVGAGTLSGNYAAVLLRAPGGGAEGLSTAMVYWSADANGSLSEVSATGHAVDEDDSNFTESGGTGAYSLNADGTGSASFAPRGRLNPGPHDIFVAADGSLVLGHSSDAESRGVLLAVERSGSSGDAAWEGDFWIAELGIKPGPASTNSAIGAVRTVGDGRGWISERQFRGSAPLNFSGINFYGVPENGLGYFGPNEDPSARNFALNAEGVFLQADVGPDGSVSPDHGLTFGVPIPELSGGGVFLSPFGILNAASFAPATYPISGGALVSLFGSGLAGATAEARSIPLPTSLAGVTVTVNGIPAPLLFVSPGQINLQVPFALAGDTATVLVNNNGDRSLAISTPLAPSSPGVFTLSLDGTGSGTITHADFSLISAASPARRGETISIFLTGLGAVDPPFPDGHPGPLNPLARTVDPNIGVLFGGARGDIVYSGAAPEFVGLYQLNVRVPDNAPLGPAVPLAIETSTATSDFVDIAIGN
jgi:uncharacterized protein (TIGR03437 family)